MFVQSQFQLSQSIELVPRVELAGSYELIYAFSRSASRQSKNYPGADYLSFTYNGSQLFFSVCDGVSNAFAGYVAAKFIGNKLVEWGRDHKGLFVNTSTLEKELGEVLQKWTQDGTELVNSTLLLLNGDETDIDFMERKRKKGSQTMFLLGMLDVEQDKAFCVGLGDIRLSVKYKSKNDPEFVVGQTKHRWSTLDGRIGNLWSRTYTLSEIDSFAVYTDGFEQFVDNSVSIQGKNELNKIVLPNDDVTFFSIRPNQEIMNRPQSRVPNYQIKDNSIVFDSVNEEEWIRVFVNDEILEVADSKIPLSEDFKSARKGQIRYQVVGSKTQPSEVELLRLELPNLQQEKTKLPANIQKRERPIVSKSTPTYSPKPALVQTPIQKTPVLTTQTTQKGQGKNWSAFVSTIRWLFAIIGWGVAVYFFLQIDKKTNEIQELNKQIDNQQSIISEFRKVPTINLTPTILPTITETPLPQKILMECRAPESGLSVYQAPDFTSLLLYSVPKDRKFSILQSTDNQEIEGWSFINDEVLSFNGWINNQAIDLTTDCIVK